MIRWAAAALACAAAIGGPGSAAAEAPPPKPEGALRIALFNVHLARREPGKLIDELRGEAAPEHVARAEAQVSALVEIIQRTDPDVLALLELDYDVAGEALALFEEALATPRGGAKGLVYAYRYQEPVNAGVQTGFDVDDDGKLGGDPEDAHGWGLFEGQFGMAVLSRHPIDAAASRTFRLIKWSEAAFAEAARPRLPGGAPFFSDPAWSALRLSSKSHWDVAIDAPGGRLRVLLSHPTPPVFDGPEDRNGARNAAEIAFWRAYLNGADWIVDDQGFAGGLGGEAFVVAGDLNNDPADGDGRSDALASLLGHSRLQDPQPASAGGAAAAAQGGANDAHRTPARFDTADWKDVGARAPGNLRVDYLLPSTDFTVVASGVFWPSPEDPLYDLVGDGRPIVSSDHRLVWIDLAWK